MTWFEAAGVTLLMFVTSVTFIIVIVGPFIYFSEKGRELLGLFYTVALMFVTFTVFLKVYA